LQALTEVTGSGEFSMFVRTATRHAAAALPMSTPLRVDERR
jgi:hypothetical protein